MLSLTGIEQVYLVGGSVDLRKSIDGLAALVSQAFALEPFVFGKMKVALPQSW